MNSYQIYNLIKEIQLIKESRINNISLCEDYSILIELYSASIKKKYLHIKVPNFLFLRNEKCDIIQANSFTKTLREKLLGSIIKEIIQCGADRIIEFKLSNDKKLIIELFLRGNIIILDNDNKIELIMDKKKFENKKSNIGEEYNIVNPAFEYKKITYEKINKLIENNKGDTIGLFIATKLNLAKEISEFLCNELNFDKNKFMNELKKEEKENLIKKIKEILKIKPSININKNSLLTIPDNNKSQFDTISEGFKKINEQLKEKITNTKYTNQINKIKNII
ncbi:hypothetical protein HOI30_02445, partial [Candidatus Woesearchaeota archaeon]|nr:hypothetical protein [Candidatus Woesearchaeota archaeon]